MGVKILNLLPVTGDVLTPEMFKYMCKYLEPDTEVQTYQITSGPPSIECEYDEALAAADVLRLAKKKTASRRSLSTALAIRQSRRHASM